MENNLYDYGNSPNINTGFNLQCLLIFQILIYCFVYLRLFLLLLHLQREYLFISSSKNCLSLYNGPRTLTITFIDACPPRDSFNSRRSHWPFFLLIYTSFTIYVMRVKAINSYSCLIDLLSKIHNFVNLLNYYIL